MNLGRLAKQGSGAEPTVHTRLQLPSRCPRLASPRSLLFPLLHWEEISSPSRFRIYLILGNLRRPRLTLNLAPGQHSNTLYPRN